MGAGYRPLKIWFSSGKSRLVLGWNFPEASRNRSPAFARIRQPAGFRRYSCCRYLAIKPYERLRESPSPTGDSTVLAFPDETYLFYDKFNPTVFCPGFFVLTGIRGIFLTITDCRKKCRVCSENNYVFHNRFCPILTESKVV